MNSKPSQKFITYTITQNTELAVDHSGYGDVCYVTAGGTVTAMHVVSYQSDGRWTEADADAESTSGPLLLALQAASTGGTFLALKSGVARDDSWAWSIGYGTSNVLYLSTTLGEITQTAPEGSGDVIQVVGYALTDDQIMFEPQLSWGVLT